MRVLLVFPGRALWNIELVQNVEGLKNSVRPVFAGKTDWLNATARTKRDGGVKSPGNPSIPVPWPNGSSVTGPSFTGGTLVIEKFT